MSWWERTLLTVAACAAVFSIVPLMVLGGTGSWRRALEALRQYLGVLGLLALAGGGVGLLMVLAELLG
jgi:hypothetical protein